MALCRRYGLTPFRYRGQRRTTLNVKVSRRFADEMLWPEFQQLSAALRRHIDDLTDRVIMTAIHGDVSDATEAVKPPELGPAG